MPVELPGSDHRILLVPREEVTEFLSEDHARLFLARFMHDPMNMAALRRALADEFSAMGVARLDDHEVIAQVARRMAGQCVAIVRTPLPPTSPPDPNEGLDPGDNDDPFDNPLEQGEEPGPEDVKPDPIIPPEFPRMAKRESDSLEDETTRYGFRLDEMRFRDQAGSDGSEIAPELPQLASQTGQRLVEQAAGMGMDLVPLAAAGGEKLDPSMVGGQLKSLAQEHGKRLLDGAGQMGDQLVTLIGGAKKVPGATAVARELLETAGKQGIRLVDQAGKVGETLATLLMPGGDAPGKTEVGPAMRELSADQAKRLHDAAKGTAPLLDGVRSSPEEQGQEAPVVGANDFAFVLLDDKGQPVVGQAYAITVGDRVFSDVTDDKGQGRADHLPLNASGTLELPNSVWAWRDRDGKLPPPTVHEVVKGDWLSKIALKYRIKDWQTIYDHPANAPFRAQRPEPGAIQPGDRIFIPDTKPRKLPVTVGKAVVVTWVGLDAPPVPISEARANAEKIVPATNIAAYIELVRKAEKVAKLSSADLLSLLRQIYYGDEEWSKSHPSVAKVGLWGRVIGGARKFDDPRELLGADLFDALQESQTVDGIDLGHVFTGVEAMRSPSDRVDIVRMPNVEFATWGGDLGSDAATKAFEDARSGTRSKWDEWFPGHEASEDDLRGDLDAYGLAKILTGGPVSDALATYYQKPASEGRPAARTRYTTFAEAVGAEVKRGRIRNKNALVQRFAPRVQAFAQAWYVKLGKEKSGAVDAALEWLKRQTPLGVDDAQRIDEYSSQITALFFDWVEKKIGEGLTAEDLGPPIHMATLRGLFFETDKCFLLPAAVEHLPAIKALYDQHPDAQILVVGHTDTAGSAEHNQALSEERAAAVAAYLRDKAPDWLAWFDDAKPASKRWGVREIGHMLSALPEGAEAEKFWTGDVPSARTPAFKEAVKKFQAWANENKGLSLDVDGVPGPMTRAALVAAYMGLDGTTLPEGTRLVTVGAGEAHPAVDTGDGKSEPANRRVELFFFDQGIDPEPSKDEDHYDEWKSRVGPTTDLGEPGPHVETGAAVSVRVVQKGDQQKDDGHPLAEEPWVVRQADGTTTPGRLDAQGHAEIRCAGDTCEVTFPRRGPGSMEALTHPGEPKPELLPVKAPAGVEAGDLEALEPVRRREFFLREHRRGDPVKALQRMLKAAGVNVEETAVYDAATIAAVKAFQESKHLEVDGVVGPATLGLLDEALGLGTTFRCHREAHAEFRWRRFLAPPPVVRPIPHDAPDPSHEQPKPSPTPSGTDPHEAPTCTPVESGWQLIERSLAALQMSPGERQREYEDLANAVIGKVTLLDEAFGAGNRDEDHAVALAVYQGFAKHGRENGRFANHKNFVRLVKIVEAMEPEASLGDVTRFLRRLYYGDDLLTLGGFGMGGGEPQISQGTKDRVIAAEFKPAWQEIWGPRAGGNDYRKLDVAHSLVALDAWVNNGASGRLRAWIFTDFGDWATGVLSALDVKDAGNDNPVDKRGNDFGEQLFGTLDDHPFEKLSALLAYCFDPSRYLHGAAHAEDYEDHGQRGASVIIESDPAYASSLESPLQPHETGGGS